MSCFSLVNPTIADMAWCGITMATGSEIIAAALLFCLFMYGIYTFKLPMQVFAPLAVMLIFIFAGAGAISPAGGITAFTNLMYIVVIIIGALIALTLWELRK